MVRTLVVLDPNDGPSGWAALVSAARRFGEVSAFVLSDDEIEAPAEVAELYRTGDPRLSDVTEDLAETLAGILDPFDRVLASTGALGRNLIPRLAGRFRAAVVTGVVEVVDEFLVKRLAFAGNVVETIRLPDSGRAMLTVTLSSFAVTDPSFGPTPSAIPVEPRSSGHGVTVSPIQPDLSIRDLDSADIVVGCGLGASSTEAVETLTQRLETLAPAAIGVTRALVDAGQAPMDILIGQTGKSISPKVYLALGLSGASQHLCGVTDAKTIVAINRDPAAPIFEMADFGVVGDLSDWLPALTEKI